jgi:hypothetical protein
VSKTQTLNWTMVCAVVTVFCFMIGLGTTFGMACLIVGIVFGCLTAYKHLRDWNLTNQAQLEAAKPLEVTAPLMTNPDSSKLFVPQPLDRR